MRCDTAPAASIAARADAESCARSASKPAAAVVALPPDPSAAPPPRRRAAAATGPSRVTCAELPGRKGQPALRNGTAAARRWEFAIRVKQVDS